MNKHWMILIFFLLFGCSSPQFPNCRIGEIPPRDLFKYHAEIGKIVAKRMNVEDCRFRFPPRLITDSEITISQFSTLLGHEPAFFSAVCNCYMPHVNTIVICKFSRLDSLAHEWVHFYQTRCMGYWLYDVCDFQEVQAITVQRWFEENYMEAPIHGKKAK